MPTLSKITIFPVKSLDGIEVSSVQISPGGSLKGDREFALFREDGRTVNGKKYPALHQIRSHFDLNKRIISLTDRKGRTSFHLDHERQGIEAWFAKYVGHKVFLRQNLEIGFPDDSERSGPTLLSTKSLWATASWFHGQGVLPKVRRRFRANLEIDAPEAFWEDRLFAAPGSAVPFQIGNVSLQGIKPCARCPVPSRDPDTGNPLSGFSKAFSEHRQATLPAYANQAQFPHYYFLSVNTLISKTEVGKVIQAGDKIKL